MGFFTTFYRRASIILLLVCMICFSQLLAYILVYLEANPVALIQLFQEVGIYRFLYITMFSSLKFALSINSLYIWLICISFLIVQWVLKLKFVFPWIVFLFTIFIWQYLLRSNILSAVSIFHKLKDIISVATLLSIILAGIFWYDSKKKRNNNHAMHLQSSYNFWIVFRILPNVWAMLLLLYLNYRREYFSFSDTLFVIVFFQIIAIFILLIIVSRMYKKSEYVLGNIYRGMYALPPYILIVIGGILLPFLLSMAGGAVIFYNSAWSNNELRAFFLFLVIILILYVSILHTIKEKKHVRTFMFLRVIEVVLLITLSIIGYTDTRIGIYVLVIMVCLYQINTIIVKSYDKRDILQSEEIKE